MTHHPHAHSVVRDVCVQFWDGCTANEASGWCLKVEKGGTFPSATRPVQAEWCSHQDSFTPIAPGPLFSLFL